MLDLTEKRQEIIAPLLKWGIIGVKDLYDICGYESNYNSFLRITRRLEKDGVLNSFMFPFYGSRNPRKFVHLSKNAHAIMSDHNQNYVDLTIKAHEAILSNVLINLKKIDIIGDAYLHKKENFRTASMFNDAIDTDGIITAKVEGQSEFMAIEIELNRKNSTLIKDKFKSYYSSHYDFAIYFFSIRTIQEVYFKYHLDFLREQGISEENSKIAFVYSPSLDKYNYDPLEAEFKRLSGKIDSLGSFFYHNQKVHPTSTPCTLDVH